MSACKLGVFSKAGALALISLSASFAFSDPAKGSVASEVLTSEPCGSVQNRPCVALVLGGGGAKGGAHIGVLKALEDQRIPIDLIVGTSIGSFVGGLYASGLDAETIQSLFANANWNAGYRDALSRSDIPMRRKRQLDRFQIHLDLGVNTAGVSLPKGFIQGQSMKSLLDDMLGVYPNFDSFDELPIPFRAVAADAETGEQVVLSQGDFATAMQASMTLPGIVRPIELDGRVLVDGGIADNIPISVAKELGADIVIAVDIGASAFDKESLQSGFSILLQLTRFLTQINVTAQKALLTEQDVLIVPELGDIGLLSFDRVDEAVELGYSATQAILASREGESLPRLSGESHKQVVSKKRYGYEIVVDEIALSNRTRLGDDYLLNRMGMQQGDVVTQQGLVEGENRLYGQGTIARIRTSWDKSKDKNVLNLDVEEKEWGPGYLDLTFAFEDDFRSFSQYQLGGSYRLTNLSPYGAEWQSTFIFGTEKSLSTELYWPIYSSGFFWSLYADYEHEVFEYMQGTRAYGSTLSTSRSLIGSVGWNTWDKFELSIGLLREYVSVEIPSYLSDILPIDELDVDQMGAVVGVNFDSLNNASFPSRGWKLKAELSRTRNDFLSTSNYSTQIDSEINGVLSFGPHSVRNLLRYQSHLEDDTFSLLGNFELGGFLNLSGNPKDTISGSYVHFFSSVYTYQIAENNFGAIEFPLYIGASVEAGNAWQTKGEVDFGDLIKSGSVFLGWDTPIGPFYLAYGMSSTSDKSLYAFLGVTF